MTKPTMELVEKVMALVAEYGRDCHCNGEYDVPLDTPEADALLSEIRQRLEAMERDAARFVAFFSAFAGDNKRFLTAVMDALPEDGESLDYIRAAIDAAMAGGPSHDAPEILAPKVPRPSN